MLFEYTGRTRSGEARTGEIKAMHREEAIALLRKQNIRTSLLLPLRKKRPPGFPKFPSAAAASQ